MDAKKEAKYKHGHVGLLEIVSSIFEQTACSRTNKEMIKKNHPIDKKCQEAVRFRLRNRLGDVQQLPTST